MFLMVGGYPQGVRRVPAPTVRHPVGTGTPRVTPCNNLNFHHQDSHLGDGQTFTELHRHIIHIYERPRMDPERKK